MKRASERQITKDDPASDGEGDPQTLRDGFDRAPPEVMARRKIVKARRSAKPPAPSPPAANPFASALSKPANGAGTAAEPTVSDGKTPEIEGSGSGDGNIVSAPGVTSDPPAEAVQPATDSALKESTPTGPAVNAASGGARNDDAPSGKVQAENGKSSDTEKLDEAKQAETVSSRADKTAKDGAPSDSVAASTHSEVASADPSGPGERSTPPADNALVDSSATEGAEKSSGVDVSGKENISIAAEAEAKRAVAEPANESTAPDENAEAQPTGTTGSAPALGEGADASKAKPAFSFGGIAASGTKTGTTFSDAAAAATGFSFSAAAASKPVIPESSKTATKFVKTDVVTGEEGETVEFRSRCKLFVLDTSKWIERGIGNLKVNVDTESKKARLVMRTDATLRVVLNTPITERFAIDPASERSVRFQGLTVDDVTKYATYLARFSAKADLDKFVAIVKSVGARTPSE